MLPKYPPGPRSGQVTILGRARVKGGAFVLTRTGRTVTARLTDAGKRRRCRVRSLTMTAPRGFRAVSRSASASAAKGTASSSIANRCDGTAAKARSGRVAVVFKGGRASGSSRPAAPCSPARVDGELASGERVWSSAHPMPSLRTLTAVLAVALAAPGAAAAAPPPNDNYLASTTIDPASATFPRTFTETVDTTEATTQADTFNPNREGVPFGGGPPEPTACGAAPYGKTAWWDFRAPHPGGVQVKAEGGFDVVVAVHEWSAQTSRITRTLTCQNDSPGSEDVVLPEVRRGGNYTVQVGGAGAAGGPVKFSLSYFPDRDDDGRFDADDRCDRLKGTVQGCPPELRAAPRIRFDEAPGGIRVLSLAIDDAPKGARAEVRGIGRKFTRRARRAGTLSLNGVAGRVARAGGKIEIRVTLGRTGKGRFRFGATGKYYRWPVTAGGLGDRVVRCLNPGSRKPIRCR